MSLWQALASPAPAHGAAFTPSIVNDGGTLGRLAGAMLRLYFSFCSKPCTVVPSPLLSHS